MLAARRLQNGCPSCTAHILRFYVNSIADIAPAAAAHRSTRLFTSGPRLHGRRNDSRLLSTTSRRSQDHSAENSKPATPRLNQLPEELAQPHSPSLPPAQELPDELAETAEDQLEQSDQDDFDAGWPVTQDPESIVRQAKFLFGDSLPPDYLSEDEYKLYERFYGPPIRTTAPEDVGFGSFGEGEEEKVQENNQNALLREDLQGNLEEVEYTMPPAPLTTEVTEDGETVLDGQRRSGHD